ncbi:sugar phosphate isomerase/epimerase [Candidatus Woesearchaeota archaeon]|nr:sugar phosphate isomerase/epimerase [Candidatus Woesearchaeota archaeon]
MKFFATWYPYDSGMEMQKLFAVIEKAEKDGFAGFEVVPPIELLPEYNKNTSFFLGKNLLFTVHFDYLGTNLCSKNKGIKEESIRQLRETIVFAGKIKAKAVVFHPGMYYEEENPEVAVTRLIGVLPSLLKFAKENNVVLAIENMENKKQQLCISPEQVMEFLQKFPDLMMCFDIAHALYTNQKKNFAEEFWRACKERVVEVHMSGIKEGMPHYKVNLGESSIDLTSFIQQLKEFSGLVKLENLNYEDIVLSKKYVEQKLGESQ